MANKVDDAGFLERVVGAASQGAAGAVVAATLSSVTEPIVNRVLVKRIPLTEAIAQVDFEIMRNFFNTAITTNFIKFPFFEVINMLLAGVDLPSSGKGAILGAVFTTATLPITNYRYCKSMGLKADLSALYKAYLPTVLRDIVYGICRNNVQAAIIERYPELTKTAQGRFQIMFLTVLVSCVVSAPGNEVRGYYLQSPENRLPVREFFQPVRFIRSTTVGALIMSIALGVGTLVTGPVQENFSALRDFLEKHPIAKTMVAIFVLEQLFASMRHQDLIETLKDAQQEKNAKEQPSSSRK